MLSAQKVRDTVMSCLYQEGEDASNAKLVKGVVGHFGFDPARLERATPAILEMLAEMSNDFMAAGGGGMSFLRSVLDKNGDLWGGQKEADELLCLGIAIGKVSFPLPREIWSALPGGVPYVVITL